MWKQILALAVLLFSAVFLLRRMPSAQASLGPSVDLGANPVVSTGGSLTGGGTVLLFTVDPGMDLVITDVLFTSNAYSCQASFSLVNSAGDVLAAFGMATESEYYYATSAASVIHRFGSGVSVPTGDSLSLSYDSSCTAYYSVSGRYVRP